MRRICIFGMGKVGFPLACAFLNEGFDVIGVDINEEIVEKLNKGISHLDYEPGVEKILEKSVRKKKFKAKTNGVEAVRESGAVIVIIPLILDQDKRPELNGLMDCCEIISKGLRKNQLVSFELTLPPGTTESILIPILEKSGLKAGDDFYVAYCPERVMPGRVLRDFRAYPRIVGGINVKSSQIAKSLYQKIHPRGVITMDNLKLAEAVKVFEGVYRDVNIGLANEFMKICDRLGIDVKKVKEAANSQPYCCIHEPGIGVGGACIPVYPYFLINMYKGDSNIIETSRKVNESMPGYFIDKLKKRVKDIKNLRVCILGLAYRPNVKDCQNSPTFDLVKGLKELDAKVSCYDPMFDKDEIKDILGVDGYDSLQQGLDDNDALIIATGYGEFKQIPEGKIVVDGRFVL